MTMAINCPEKALQLFISDTIAILSLEYNTPIVVVTKLSMFESTCESSTITCAFSSRNYLPTPRERSPPTRSFYSKRIGIWHAGDKIGASFLPSYSVSVLQPRLFQFRKIGQWWSSQSRRHGQDDSRPLHYFHLTSFRRTPVARYPLQITRITWNSCQTCPGIPRFPRALPGLPAGSHCLRNPFENDRERNCICRNALVV